MTKLDPVGQAGPSPGVFARGDSAELAWYCRQALYMRAIVLAWGDPDYDPDDETHEAARFTKLAEQLRTASHPGVPVSSDVLAALVSTGIEDLHKWLDKVVVFDKPDYYMPEIRRRRERMGKLFLTVWNRLQGRQYERMARTARSRRNDGDLGAYA